MARSDPPARRRVPAGPTGLGGDRRPHDDAPYQDKLAPEDAVARMRGLAGTTLDPAVLRALEAAVARRQTLVFVDEDNLPPDEGGMAAE